MRYATAVPLINEQHIAYYNGSRSVTITGLVVDEPDVSDRFVNLRVDVDSIQVSGGAQLPMQGTVQVQTYRFPVINYGSRLRVTGILETPPEDETFSYRAYLARQGIHSLMSLPNVTVLAENEGNPLYRAIFAFKSRAQATIAQLIPEPQAALLTGILLGNDNGLPPDLAEAFRTTGMTHVIAISGFNIAILVAILVRLAEPFLPPAWGGHFCPGGHLLLHRFGGCGCFRGPGGADGQHLPGDQSLAGTAEFRFCLPLFGWMGDDDFTAVYPLGCRLSAQFCRHPQPDALRRPADAVGTARFAALANAGVGWKK
jgi:hypothetical protein